MSKVKPKELTGKDKATILVAKNKKLKELIKELNLKIKDT